MMIADTQDTWLGRFELLLRCRGGWTSGGQYRTRRSAAKAARKLAQGREFTIEDHLPRRLSRCCKLPWIVVVSLSHCRHVVYFGQNEDAAAAVLVPGTVFGKASSFASAKLLAEQNAAMAVASRLQAVKKRGRHERKTHV